MVKVRFGDAPEKASCQKRRTEPFLGGFFPPSPPSVKEGPPITRDITSNTPVEGTSQKDGPRDSEGCPPPNEGVVAPELTMGDGKRPRTGLRPSFSRAETPVAESSSLPCMGTRGEVLRACARRDRLDRDVKRPARSLFPLRPRSSAPALLKGRQAVLSSMMSRDEGEASTKCHGSPNKTARARRPHTEGSTPPFPRQIKARLPPMENRRVQAHTNIDKSGRAHTANSRGPEGSLMPFPPLTPSPPRVRLLLLLS
jgi:hypothetical protein